MGLTSDKYFDQDEEVNLSKNLSLLDGLNRDRLMIELALYSGAREGELIWIDSLDLNPRTRSVYIRRPLKGSNQREVPLPNEFFSRLWVYSRKVDGRLFDIGGRRVRQIWEDFRPINKKFHALRHTFARKVYSKTKDIRLVQNLLGHKSIASTGIYTEIDYEVDQKRKALGL